MDARLAPLLLLGFLGCSATRGEIALSAYGGKAWNSDADLRLSQPGGTDLTLFGVALEDRSFEGPVYYGLRATYWFPPAGADGESARLGTWGAMLDFTHAKAIADEDQVVRQQGTRSGTPVDGDFPVSDSIDGYELSHGHNLLTLDAVHRWSLGDARGRGLKGRLQPYVGAGAGAAIPHVEATVNGVETSGYQLAGWTVAGLAGMSIDIAGPVSGFIEYKLNWADVDGHLDGGGSIRQEIWTQQLVLGLSIRF
jgi:lipid A oxidase